jgi:hypothetical protein
VNRRTFLASLLGLAAAPFLKFAPEPVVYITDVDYAAGTITLDTERLVRLGHHYEFDGTGQVSTRFFASPALPRPKQVVLYDGTEPIINHRSVASA